jgi:MoaA/NifB/PqqE/SkfB family radical SAM enzyme
MTLSNVSWTFYCPCKDSIKRKHGGTSPKNLDNYFIRKESFGTLFYSKSRTPVFNESYFEESSESNSKFILSAPVLAILEVTGKCNLNCVHCYRPETKKTEELSFNVVKSLISEFKDMGVIGILYLGGEPFLHKDLSKMLEESKRAGLKNEIITNGYKISDTTIEECNSLIDGLHVSIDGRRDVHNRIRGASDSFDYALNTLGKFSIKGTYTTVLMTLNKLNYTDVEDVYAAVSEQGAKEIFIKRMLSTGKGREISDLCLKQCDMADLENRTKAMQNDKTKIKFGGVCNKPAGEYTFFGCPGGRTQIIIDCDGAAYRCLYQKEPHKSIGNIYDISVSDIWKKNIETLEFCICNNSDRCGGLCTLTS